jgi:hypothetical protein
MPLSLNPSGTHAPAVREWIEEHPTMGSAIWRSDDRVRVLEWTHDHERYSMSGLAERIIEEAVGTHVPVSGAE